jgi:RNA polymerase sigma factor (sigma-70 family)
VWRDLQGTSCRPAQDIIPAQPLTFDLHRNKSRISSKVAGHQNLRSFDVVNQAVESLSPREREVLELVAEGCLFKEIAEKLGVSFGTVHTYCRRIYEKLQVRSRGQAVAKWHHK